MKRVGQVTRMITVGSKVRIISHNLPNRLIKYAGKEGVVTEVLADCSYARTRISDLLQECPANHDYILCTGRIAVSWIDCDLPTRPECYGYGSFVLERRP